MASGGEKKENSDFRCVNCKRIIERKEYIGTKHRNHCPSCLYSKHVDLNNPGDREASCKSKMEPIALTVKKEGKDRYGKERIGELMLVHRCCNEKCKKVSINRIAGDDDAQSILQVYTDSLKLNDKQKEGFISKHGITVLDEDDEDIVNTQLFGSNHKVI